MRSVGAPSRKSRSADPGTRGTFPPSHCVTFFQASLPERNSSCSLRARPAYLPSLTVSPRSHCACHSLDVPVGEAFSGLVHKVVHHDGLTLMGVRLLSDHRRAQDVPGSCATLGPVVLGFRNESLGLDCLPYKIHGFLQAVTGLHTRVDQED